MVWRPTRILSTILSPLGHPIADCRAATKVRHVRSSVSRSEQTQSKPIVRAGASYDRMEACFTGLTRGYAAHHGGAQVRPGLDA